MNEIDKAMEEAHKDYIKRRQEIVTKLIVLKDSDINKTTRREWLSQAINFIYEKEI